MELEFVESDIGHAVLFDGDIRQRKRRHSSGGEYDDVHIDMIVETLHPRNSALFFDGELQLAGEVESFGWIGAGGGVIFELGGVGVGGAELGEVDDVLLARVAGEIEGDFDTGVGPVGGDAGVEVENAVGVLESEGVDQGLKVGRPGGAADIFDRDFFGLLVDGESQVQIVLADGGWQIERGLEGPNNGRTT
jgi:hypothetical protein